MIDNETLREEIRKIIREELHSILFEKREFEMALTTYMKSLLYNEIKYLKMFENGFINRMNDKEFYFNFKGIGRLGFNISEDVHLKEIYQKLLSEKAIDTSYKIFEAILLCKDQTNEKINFIGKVKRSKAPAQQFIFDFLYVMDCSIINLNTLQKKFLFNFICRSFLLDGVEIMYNNIENSYSKWLKKINRAEM